MASEKKDPTVKSGVEGDLNPKGADLASSKQYADNPDKPDPTTVAQVEVLPE